MSSNNFIKFHNCDSVLWFLRLSPMCGWGRLEKTGKTRWRLKLHDEALAFHTQGTLKVWGLTCSHAKQQRLKKMSLISRTYIFKPLAARYFHIINAHGTDVKMKTLSLLVSRHSKLLAFMCYLSVQITHIWNDQWSHVTWLPVLSSRAPTPKNPFSGTSSVPWHIFLSGSLLQKRFMMKTLRPGQSPESVMTSKRTTRVVSPLICSGLQFRGFIFCFFVVVVAVVLLKGTNF